MTMTSVAVGPASLAVPNMLGPKRYLQQGPNAPSSGSSKGYETLSKGKKSWSVRLGLSRASSQQRNSVQESVVPPGKHYPVGAGGWGTVSGGSVLAQQMIYAEPWLYGTVRATSSPVAHHHHHHGYHPAGAAPVILVCSCPEFLHGTARDLGSNCRKCGGHRLAGLAAIGGTCRVPTSNVRSRPSLAGMLRPSTDDPYDLMRRSRLLEPKSSRARSISPLRLQAGLQQQQQQQQQQLQQLQQQQRSQSVVRSLGSSGKSNPKIATVEPMSRTEWFDTGDLCNSATSTGALDRLIDDNSKLSSEPKESDWASKKSVSTQDISTIRSQPGRLVRLPNPNKVRTWQQTPPPKPEEEPISSPAANTSVDSRKSILECDVNPYLLMKNKQQHREDELSDDLSDNALEHEPKRTNNNNNTSSLNKNSNNLFDPSKVKSIERIPNRSSVAAIGGQRIRVFNETREPSDEDDPTSPTATLTRIPIPKISPKRPPRRLKEAKNALKSILKRSATATSSATTATSESSSSSASKFNEPKRKSVLFNVDNVILAPEKPPSPADICIGNPPQRKTSKSSLQPAPAPPVPPPQVPTMPSKDESSKESETSSTCESPIVPEEVVQQPRFITIPNIKSFKQPPPQPPQQPPPKPPQQPPQQQQQQQQTAEAKIVPRVKNNAPATVEKIKIDKFVPSKKQQLQDQHQQANRVAQNTPEEQQPESKTEPEKKSPVETIAKCEEVSANQKSSSTSTTTNLTRSQSERSNSRPTMSAAEVGFVDTMRLSLGRTRAKEDEQPAPQSHQDQTNQEAAARKISFEEARKRVAIKKRESKTTSTSNVMTGRIVEEETIEEPTTTHQQQQQQLKRQQDEEHFVKMRPTSWSPPPGKPRPPASSSNNVCKITVSPPREAPPPPPAHLVHRLQIGSPSVPVTGSRGTSILINGSSDQQQPQQQQTRETSGSTATPAGTNGSHHNKVTINVGGEPPSNGVCNPTVISINSPKSQDIPSAVHHHHHHHQRQSSSGSSVTSSSAGTTSGDQKRTLVIFDNYKSNIVIGGEHALEPQEPQVQQERAPIEAGKPTTPSSKPIEIKPTLKFKEVEESPDSSPRWKQILDAPKSSGSSKEELISKLLEDSLRKARENGEILDESSGEAILKILKQSLLKSSSEADPEYFRPSRSNRDADTIATNMFIEENAYEVIKEPIYEEIPDEPPPLPLSPPPTEDFLKRDRIFFGDELGPALGAYYKPYPEETFKNNNSGSSMPTVKDNLSSKFELLNFIMDSKERTRNGNVALDQEEEEEEDEEEEEEEEEEEDPERDLEALYEQKEMSLGDLSSKSSQISNVSDSSEECNIILTNSPEALKTRTVDIERTDSGVGSESSQASSGRGGSTTRRWRSSPGSAISGATTTSSSTIASSTAPATTTITAANSTTLATPLQKQPMPKSCEDCEQRLEPLIIDSVYSPVVCRKCNKKRAERKEIITEIVETEQKYGRDLQIILEEFHRPMLRAGLLTPEQLSAIFLNVEELLEHNQILAEKLKDAVDFAQETNDEDLVRVDLGKIFLESERMLHAFESYCTRQGGASLLLQNLEKEKELLRIFLKVSQMENTVLRRMNLNSFLMVPVQRVTKYPLLLSRLLKATPSGRPEMQELKKRLKQAQTNIELHLEHMNAEAKDITSTKLWRRISIIQNGRRSTGEQDMVNIKLRKMAVEVLEWAHEDSRFVLEGKLLVAQPTDNNWRRGRTVKLAPITAMLVTNGKPNNDFVDLSDDSLFPKQIGVKEATLLLVKEKLGRYSLLREPLYLDKCIVCCETDLEDYFEIQELSSKETFIFKAEDGARTKRWCRTLQAHAQSLGAWRRRRGALPNIMICGVARN